MKRRVRLDLLLGVALLAVVAAALLYHQSAATPHAGPPKTSPRQAAAAFGAAYMQLLDGRLADALPDASAAVRASAARGAYIPPPARAGALRLVSVQTRWVTGAVVAQARITGRDAKHTYPADLDLAYENGAWRVVYVTPPDVATILATPATPATPEAGGAHRPGPPPPPPAITQAATRFALAYADYRERATATPPPALPTLSHQIQSGSDPLAQLQPSHAPATAESIAVGPPSGGVVAATATLSDRGAPVTFSFNLMHVGSQWRAWSFPLQATP